MEDVVAGPGSATTTPPATRPADRPDPWWTAAVGYQVYLQSFDDASGDGVGDLEGLRRRLGYVADLGVDYIWITPFYPSPKADHGYDVAGYTAVDPAYGTLDEFDRVLHDAHGHGLRVVIDVVPNHTSDRHPWFVDAVSGRGAPRRNWYVWRDPAPDGGPPNNWVSKFGGPAWTLHEPTGQYYMHTFLPEQPDLNWADPEVREAFDRILRFWLDRGVDGFRVDTAHLLTEDPHFRDNPQLEVPPDGADPQTVYESFEHRHDLDQPDVTDVYRRWHGITAAYGAMLLGEVFLLEPDLVLRYVDDGVLDLAFYFPALKASWDAASIRDAVGRAALVSRGRFTWPLSSHDDPRAATRFGGGSRGGERSLAYLTFLAGLPGGVCLLQGDELGIDTADLPADTLRDPVATRNPGAAGRDSSRTPMPWSVGPGHGFTTGVPWMAFPNGLGDADTVERQQHDPSSSLSRTRELLRVRRGLPDLRGHVPITWLSAPASVVAYRRGDTVVALNTGAEPQTLAVPRARIRYASRPTEQATATGVPVPVDGAVIVTVDD